VISPCGLVMDYLRSGYRTEMRMQAGQEPVPVRWFRVGKDRPVFPEPHRFGSLNWEDDHENDGIGEQSAPERTYDKGKPPAIFIGTRPCGPIELFRGQTPDKPVTPLRYVMGVPECCKTAPAPSILGNPGAITAYRGRVPLGCSSCANVPGALNARLVYLDGLPGIFTGFQVNVYWNGSFLEGTRPWNAEWNPVVVGLTCAGIDNQLFGLVTATFVPNPSFGWFPSDSIPGTDERCSPYRAVASLAGPAPSESGRTLQLIFEEFIEGGSKYVL